MDTATANAIQRESQQTGILKRRICLAPWPGPWEKYARNYCYKNQWRLAHAVGDLDDCIQEAALVWVEISRRYGGSVNSAAQMMALYKLGLSCWFNVLSVKDSNYRKMKEQIPDREPQTNGDTELLTSLSETSSELKDVIKVFMSAPKEIVETIRNDVASRSLVRFFEGVASFCKISVNKSKELAQELASTITHDNRNRCKRCGKDYEEHYVKTLRCPKTKNQFFLAFTT